MKKQTQFRLWVLYALFLLICSLLETTLLARFPIFGVRIVLLPAVAALVGVHRGAEQGGIFGLIAGVYWVLAGAGSPMVVLTMTLGGLFAGWLCDAVLTRNLLSALIASAVSLLGTLTIAGLVHAYMRGGSALILLYSVWQTLISLPFAAVLYYPARSIGRTDEP